MNLFAIWEICGELWTRSLLSYERAHNQYLTRRRTGLQPATPFIDVFDINQQYSLLIIANMVYIFTTVLIIRHMRTKALAYRLRWVLVIYDAANVILTAYIAYAIIMFKLKNGLLICNSLLNDRDGHRMARIFTLFYAQKYLEFFDTWFFLLRKSFKQVTFMHLFHKSSITIVVGGILPFDYNGDMYLPILLNSLNHMLIYLHYLLASVGVRSRWASSITSLQLAQFVVIFLQSLVTYRIGPTCGSPDFAKVLMILYMVNMVALFINFFLQKYVLGQPYAVLDLWGVCKRPRITINTIGKFYGTAALDQCGNALVLLPDEFPDEKRLASRALLFEPFCVVYQLTPLGDPMPALHVSREVYRYDDFSPSVNKKGEVFSSGNAPASSSVAPAPLSSSSVSSSAVASNGSSYDDQLELWESKGPEHKDRGQNSHRKHFGVVHGAKSSADSLVRSKSISMSLNTAAKRGVPKENRDSERERARSSIPKSMSLNDLDVSIAPPCSSPTAPGSTHNDRLIDGPLPRLPSFYEAKGYVQKTINTLGALSPHRAAFSSTFAARVPDASSAPRTLGAIGKTDESEGTSSHLTLTEVSEKLVGLLDKSRLCFGISGGTAGGKVSWFVGTIPYPSHRRARKTETKAADNDSRDWRAFN